MVLAALGQVSFVGCGKPQPASPPLQVQGKSSEIPIGNALAEKSLSGEYTGKPEELPEPPAELFRPLPLRQRKLQLKEMFLEGVADLEAEEMVQTIILEQEQRGTKGPKNLKGADK